MKAIDCRDILNRTHKLLLNVNYNIDLHLLYKNLDFMVGEISKIEVECRRKQNYKMLETPIKEFKEGVDRLEKLILIAKLME